MQLRSTCFLCTFEIQSSITLYKLHCDVPLKMISLARVYLFPSDFVKVFDGSGFEIFRSEGCSFPYQSSLLELPFGEFDFITVQVQLGSPQSRFAVQYFVIKQSLQSG